MDDPIPAWVREKFPKIEHFYRRLPILPEQEKHVEMMMARMIGWCTLTHSRNRKGKKETIRQLDGLAKRSTKLLGDLDSLSPTAWEAIEEVWPKHLGAIPIEFFAALKNIALYSEEAKGCVPDDAEWDTKRFNTEALRRVQALVEQYRQLTGKQPTLRWNEHADDPTKERGEMYEFAKGVLSKLGWKEDPERYIKEIRTGRKGDTP